MNFLHYDLVLGNGDSVKVTLDKQANVRLLDDINYSNYKNGKKFNYFGGKALKSPLIINPPHPGNWNLVIDLGGYSGTVRASVRIIRGKANAG
jgi:hypothetical protein